MTISRPDNYPVPVGTPLDEEERTAIALWLGTHRRLGAPTKGDWEDADELLEQLEIVRASRPRCCDDCIR